MPGERVTAFTESRHKSANTTRSIWRAMPLTSHDFKINQDKLSSVCVGRVSHMSFLLKICLIKYESLVLKESRRPCASHVPG